MRKIPLTKGLFAIVDDVDYELVSAYKWHMASIYARRRLPGTRLVRKSQMMHHLIIGQPPDGFVVDHINRNPLDNRRNNLRFVTRLGNYRNSEYAETAKGYTFYPRCPNKPWRAYYRDKTLGYFSTESEARKAYLQARHKHEYGVQ